jgi:hypothetical protein
VLTRACLPSAPPRTDGDRRPLLRLRDPPAVLQQGSITRQPLGVAPFAMFIAALPLASAWRAATTARPEVRVPLGAGIAAVIAVMAAITVHDYFSTWRRATLTAFVYHAEVTAASEYMRTLPPDTSVYFYSDRHPFRIETRQFLAPNIHGSDRSSEFSAFSGSITKIDRTRPVVFVLLGRYRSLAPDGPPTPGKIPTHERLI